MTTLSDLIARLEAAKEGSADLDIEISELSHPDEVAAGETVSIIRYTRSLDAALTLVPTGWSEEIKRSRRRLCWRVNLWFDALNPVRDAIQSADAPTAPLALCIAALRAREARR